MDKREVLGERYASGFIRKMASAGVPEQTSVAMLRKMAGVMDNWGRYGIGAGALGGGALAAMLAKPEVTVDKDGNEKKKYHRLRKFILGALAGGVGGGFAGAVFDNTPAGIRSNARIDAKPSLLGKAIAKVKANADAAQADRGE